MKVNALQIRQSFGRILKQLQKLGEPIVIEKNREPVAVLISFEIFKQRFLDYREEEKRNELLAAFGKNPAKSSKNSLTLLRELRYGQNR